MFGLNDEDKKQQPEDDAAAANPLVGNADSAAPAGVGPILPTTAVVSPNGPQSPPPDLAAAFANPPLGIEAIPSPATGPSSSSPPAADAVMPEESPFISPKTSKTSASTDTKPPADDNIGKSDDLDARIAALSSDSGEKGGLVKLKQQALQSLAPLVDKLDQTPEEKFKTTMMLIQASDNADLVPKAYEAANQITDEKARAQALLDVVNEINYFTQSDKPED